MRILSVNRPDIVINDKKRKEIIFIEVGITSQDQLQIVENEKARKYDVLAKEMGAMHNCKTRIIPYVMTWDGIVTKFHAKYSKEIGLTTKIEAYIQYIVLKKTLESISFDYRRECNNEVQNSCDRIVEAKIEKDESIIEKKNLDDTTLLETLKDRYKSGQIYTNCGLILLSINPYKTLDIYSPTVAQLYRKDPINLRPHIYGLLENVINDTKLFGEHSIIVSGESGSGKTECAKRMLEYLNIPEIASIDIILEAFGNAKTVNNDNSSRFGKLIRLHRNVSIDTFLLEKSRVTSSSEGENNFHVFYYVLAHLKTSITNDYIRFNYSSDFNEPNKAWSSNIECYETEYNKLVQAFTAIGEDFSVIENILLGIIHLGSIKIEEKRIEKDVNFYNVIKYLRFKEEVLEEYLLYKTLRIGGEEIKKSYSKKESLTLRDSIARLLYSNLFNFVLKKINNYLLNIETKVENINILDIFGFESFTHNGLDQFCINWCNERIYEEFVDETFKHQKEILLSEKILSNEFTGDNFSNTSLENENLRKDEDIKISEDKKISEDIRKGDTLEGEIMKISENMKISEDMKISENLRKGENSKINNDLETKEISKNTKINNYLESEIKNIKIKDSIIPTIEKKCGIVDLIAEESFINGNADNLSVKLENILKLKICGPRTLELEHFAGKIKYDLNDFISKNKEKGSLSGLINDGLFDEFPISNGSENIVGFFRNSLNLLFSLLKRTKIKYIRCIKPNADKKPMHFEDSVVHSQLKASGVLECIELSKYLYPYMVFIDEFEERYSFIKNYSPDMLKSLGLVKGSTRYCFNNFCYNYLEITLENIEKKASENIKNFILLSSSKCTRKLKYAQNNICKFYQCYSVFYKEKERKRQEILKIEELTNEELFINDIDLISDELLSKGSSGVIFSTSKKIDVNKNTSDNKNTGDDNIIENKDTGGDNIVDKKNTFETSSDVNKNCTPSDINKDIPSDIGKNCTPYDIKKDNTPSDIKKDNTFFDVNNKNITSKISTYNLSEYVNDSHLKYDKEYIKKTTVLGDTPVSECSTSLMDNKLEGLSEEKYKQIIKHLQLELSKYKSFSVSCANCQILMQKYKIQSKELQKKQSLELELEKYKKRLRQYEDQSDDNSVESPSVYNIFGCLIQLYLDYCPVFSNKDIPKDEMLSLAHSIKFVLEIFDDNSANENVIICLDEINKRLSDFEENISMVAFVFANLIELKIILRDWLRGSGSGGNLSTNFSENNFSSMEMNNGSGEKLSTNLSENTFTSMELIDSTINTLFGQLCNLQKKTLNDILPGSVIEYQHLKEFRAKESIYKKIFSPPSITKLREYLEYFYNLNTYFYIPDAFIMHNLSHLLSFIDFVCFNSMLAKKKFLNRNRCMQIAYNLTEIEKFCFNVSFHHGFYNMAYMREAIRVAMGISKTDDLTDYRAESAAESSFLNQTQINTIIDLFEQKTISKLPEDQDNKKFIDEPKIVVPSVDMIKSNIKFVRPKFLPDKSLRSILRILKD